MASFSFDIDDTEGLQSIAQKIAELTLSQKVIIFNGEMGAGKTTLIKEVCKFLNVQGNISSPTYAIVNTYLTSDDSEIYHFDFYRLQDEMEAVQSGLDEMIDSGKICLIEWAERIMKLLPPTYVRVNISITGINNRKIEITY